MNRADLQLLARERIQDAEALIAGGRWSFAYYVAGYVVECALKSCFLARMVHTGWVFQEKVKIDECLTHDFKKLIQLAGLTDELNNAHAASAVFFRNWGTATQWMVAERYVSKTETEAKALLTAINDDPDGVLPWIMKYW